MSSLTLYIPGLLHPSRDMDDQDIPSIPAIDKLLACGRRDKLPQKGFSETLCSFFGLYPDVGQDLPVAAITRLVDDEHSLEGIWMRVDPVHLAADIDGFILMDETTFALDQHDALVLAADIKEILAERGLLLEVPTTNRWYLQLDKMPGIRTAAIHEVVGNNVNQFMPAGENKAYWDTLSNDIQMCLHASQLNEDRQQQGKSPVNSVWFWGSGALPLPARCHWSSVYSDDEITQGLAKHATIPWSGLPENGDEVLGKDKKAENMLVVISFGLRHAQYHDLKGWQDFIAYLEQYWFVILLNGLKSGELEELILITEQQKITITKRSLYKLWKRRKTIREYIN